jgi:hypothetical protein
MGVVSILRFLEGEGESEARLLGGMGASRGMDAKINCVTKIDLIDIAPGRTYLTVEKRGSPPLAWRYHRELWCYGAV